MIRWLSGANMKKLIASVALFPQGLIHTAMPATTTRPTAGKIHQAKVLRPLVPTGTKAVGFIDITYVPLVSCAAKAASSPAAPKLH